MHTDVHFMLILACEFFICTGAKVYIACRSLDRAHNAAEDIRSRTGVNESQLQIIQLDLNSLQSVRDFAAEFKTSKLLVLFSVRSVRYTSFQLLRSLFNWQTLLS